MSNSQAGTSVTKVAEAYYDSTEADQFYLNIWGGEDIHIGLYETGNEPIFEASRATVTRMADTLRGVSRETRVLDIGAGYGGAARYLASRFGCHVTCLNLSETQNARNRALCLEQGLADRIEVVHGNFEALPFEADRFDVVWSQDAILHSGRRAQVVSEVGRVLKAGGQFLFTDPMQADTCPPGVLQAVLDRIHLDSLGSPGFYRAELQKLGFTELSVTELSKHLGRHYARVRKELEGRYQEMTERSSRAYVDRMLEGLGHWVNAEAEGYLCWGILHFQAP